uniref:Uncharacterized protein n=1 Tax=Opuntia streptacantha TaxID=393608 RepID=A0A7C8ZSQ3_OPUST
MEQPLATQSTQQNSQQRQHSDCTTKNYITICPRLSYTAFQLLPALTAACTNSSQLLNPPESTSAKAPITSKASCKSPAEVISSNQDNSSLENPTISLTFRSFSFITTSQPSKPLSSSPSDCLDVPSPPAEEFLGLKNCWSCSIRPV